MFFHLYAPQELIPKCDECGEMEEHKIITVEMKKNECGLHTGSMLDT